MKKSSSTSDENQEDDLYVPPQRHREQRTSSLASIGSNILEEIIEGAGAVLQEADKVLEGVSTNNNNNYKNIHIFQELQQAGDILQRDLQVHRAGPDRQLRVQRAAGP